MRSPEQFNFSKQEDQEKFEALTKEKQEEIIERAYEEAEKMILAKTQSMEYEPSIANVESRIKDGTWHWEDDDYKITMQGEYVPKGNKFYKGKRIVGGGCGTYVLASPAHFNLNIELENGKKAKIWTERDFRLALGIKKLSPRIREIIENNMPTYAEVIEKTGRKGKKYYRLTEDEILKWSKKVKEQM